MVDPRKAPSSRYIPLDTLPSDVLPSDPLPRRPSHSRSWARARARARSRSRFRSRYHVGPGHQQQHHYLAWMSAVLTMLMLTLTVIHSADTATASSLRFLSTSSSDNIFVLSVLSGLTGLSLAATISAALESLKWALLARTHGLKLAEFLALQPGTGMWGLLKLALWWGKGVPLLSGTRGWSLVRVVGVVLVPVLGVLIMSNVNNHIVFDPTNDAPFQGWGMSPFNASLAKNVSAVTDQLLQAELSQFLSEPSRAVDITPASDLLIPCSRGPNVESTQNCHRAFFLPGGVELAVPNPQEDNSSSTAEAYLASDQQGCVLNFVEGSGTESEWNFQLDSECEVYGFPFGAFLLCLKNAGENVLQARIVQCPTEVATSSYCLSDKGWFTNSGWSTSLTTTFRSASTAYSKSNGTILSNTFSSSPSTLAPVDAGEMLDGYRSAFGTFSNIASLMDLLADPNATNLFALYVYPAVVWANLKGVYMLGPTNPTLVTRAQDTLQCLLAIMLYYCQPSLFASALTAYAENATLAASSPDLSALAKEVMEVAPPDTQVYQAVLRYQLTVDPPRLVAYTGLCVAALVACVGALIWSARLEGKEVIPKTTPFPGLDEGVRCQVEWDGEELEEVEKFGAEKMLREAEGIRVKLYREGS